MQSAKTIDNFKEKHHVGCRHWTSQGCVQIEDNRNHSVSSCRNTSQLWFVENHKKRMPHQTSSAIAPKHRWASLMCLQSLNRILINLKCCILSNCFSQWKFIELDNNICRVLKERVLNDWKSCGLKKAKKKKTGNFFSLPNTVDALVALLEGQFLHFSYSWRMLVILEILQCNSTPAFNDALRLNALFFFLASAPYGLAQIWKKGRKRTLFLTAAKLPWKMKILTLSYPPH